MCGRISTKIWTTCSVNGHSPPSRNGRYYYVLVNSAGKFKHSSDCNDIHALSHAGRMQLLDVCSADLVVMRVQLSLLRFPCANSLRDVAPSATSTLPSCLPHHLSHAGESVGSGKQVVKDWKYARFCSLGLFHTMSLYVRIEWNVTFQTWLWWRGNTFLCVADKLALLVVWLVTRKVWWRGVKGPLLVVSCRCMLLINWLGWQSTIVDAWLGRDMNVGRTHIFLFFRVVEAAWWRWRRMGDTLQESGCWRVITSHRSRQPAHPSLEANLSITLIPRYDVLVWKQSDHPFRTKL